MILPPGTSDIVSPETVKKMSFVEERDLFYRLSLQVAQERRHLGRNLTNLRPFLNKYTTLSRLHFILL